MTARDIVARRVEADAFAYLEGIRRQRDQVATDLRTLRRRGFGARAVEYRGFRPAPPRPTVAGLRSMAAVSVLRSLSQPPRTSGRKTTSEALLEAWRAHSRGHERRSNVYAAAADMLERGEWP